MTLNAAFEPEQYDVIYEPADLQVVIDFAWYSGFRDFSVIDAATGEVVYEL